MKSIKKLMDTTEWEYTVVSDEGATDKLCMYLNFGDHSFSVYRRDDGMIVVTVDACKSITLRSEIQVVDVIEMCLYCMNS